MNKLDERYFAWMKQAVLPSTKDAFIAGYRARQCDEGLEACDRLCQHILTSEDTSWTDLIAAE